MRPSMLAWPAALLLASLAALGCKTTISADDPDPDPDTSCEEPKPEVPPGTWCPPAYECLDGEWVDTAGACPEPECPESKPANGSPCPLIGQMCPYEEQVPCGPIDEVDYQCTDQGWVTTADWCQPEPECPDDLPVAGADCTGWDYAYACQYMIQTSCGQEMVFLSCAVAESGAMEWNIESPSTCAVCNDHGTEAECAASAECQWLTPGCSETPTQTGCYPKVGCDVVACNDDSICVQTTYDPCYGELCEACGASYFACLPGWAP